MLWKMAKRVWISWLNGRIFVSSFLRILAERSIAPTLVAILA